jgi:hypothetical protein
MKFKLTVFLLLFCFSSYSQNYKPGSITYKNGEIKNADIKVEKWNISLNVIKIKNNDGLEEKITGREIISFEIFDKKKRKFKLIDAEVTNYVSNSSKALSGMVYPYNYQFNKEKIKKFGELVICSDKIALYRIFDQGEVLHLFIERNNKFEELKYMKYTSYYLGNSTKFFEAKDETYKKQLNELDSVYSFNNNISYDTKSIAKEFAKNFEKNHEKYTWYKPKTPVKAIGFTILGAFLVRLIFFH